MEKALLISIIAGILIFLFIMGIAAAIYQHNNKKMRYRKEHPNDWLLYRLNDRLYDVLFGKKYPEDVAQKLGIEADEYYKNCRLIREEPNLKEIIMGYIHGYFVFLLCLILTFLIHPVFLLFGVLLMYILAYYKKTMVKNKANKMREQVASEFPRFIAILSSELEIGLPVEIAINILSQKFDSLISKEFLESMNEVKLGGVGWQTALIGIAEKYDMDNISDFVMDITSAYQKGISVSEAVKIRAKDLKQKRMYEVRDKAGKTENTILIPIAVLQFIPMLAFVLIPSFLSVTNL